MANKKIPFGANWMDTRALYKEREYYASSYLTPTEADGLIDFWNDERMRKYGMVNLQNQPIRLDSSFIKTIPSPPNNPENHAVNFVADAYADLKKYMDSAGPKSEGPPAIEAHSKFYNIQVNIQNSWESIDRSYERHLRNFFDPFTEQYLQVPHYKKQVHTIDDFANMLLQATRDVGRGIPVTKTAWADSIKTPVNFNGLTIEIGSDKNDHSDDYSKTDWIDDNSFKFWLRACRLHGFFVDRNAPWKIVANLGSLRMKKYMAKYKIYSLQQLFDVYYVPTHMDDIKQLKTYIYQFWKAFLRFEPELEETHYSFGHQQTEVERKQRVDISRNVYTATYGDLYWTRFWFNMRCYELGIKIKTPERKRIFNTAAKIKKDLDIDSALDYIVSILLKKSGQRHDPEKSFLHRKKHRQVIRKT